MISLRHVPILGLGLIGGSRPREHERAFRTGFAMREEARVAHEALHAASFTTRASGEA